MFDKLFNIYLFKKENHKNFQFLNHHEILNQFSYIDFENMYVNIDMLIGTNKIFDWTEFNPNIQDSVMFDFFNKIKKYDLNMIYNGYILKSILYLLLKNYSIKSIPFQTIYNIRTWKDQQRNININLGYELQKQKVNVVDINKLAYVFCEIATLYSELYYEMKIDILYRIIYHYFQVILDNNDFNYILDQKKFFVRFECTKKINKTIHIKNKIVYDLFSSFLYEYKLVSKDYNYKHKNERLNFLENLIEETFVFDKKDVDYKKQDISFINEIKKPYKISNYKIDNYYDYELLNYEDFANDPFATIDESEWGTSLLDSIYEKNNSEKSSIIDNSIASLDDYKNFLYKEE